MKRALLLGVFLAARAGAAGFAVGEQGAAAMGQASAVTASRGDPSAAYFNPASIAGDDGATASADLTVIAPLLSAEDPATGTVVKTSSGPATPPTLCASWDSGPLALGLYSGLPFGASLAWPDGWRGRFEITDISLQSWSLSPFVAYRVTDKVGLAAGVDVHLATVKLGKRLDFVDQEGSVVLGGAGHGFGLAASALWEPAPEWRVGVSYRSRANVSFSGRAHFDNVPLAFEGKAHDQDVTTAVTLPDRASLGVERHWGQWRASAQLDYTAWQTFQSFDINFSDPQTPSVSQPRNWHGAVAVRAGGSYRMTDRPVTLRAGLLFDQMPSPADTLSPTLPDSNRVGASLGGGWAFGQVQLDAAYMFVFLTGSQSDGPEVLAAKYGGTAHLFALGVTWRR